MHPVLGQLGRRVGLGEQVRDDRRAARLGEVERASKSHSAGAVHASRRRTRRSASAQLACRRTSGRASAVMGHSTKRPREPPDSTELERVLGSARGPTTSWTRSSPEEVERRARRSTARSPRSSASWSTPTIRTRSTTTRSARVQAEIEAHHRAAARRSQLDGPYGVRFRTDGRGRAWGNAVVGLRNAVAPPLTSIATRRARRAVGLPPRRGVRRAAGQRARRRARRWSSTRCSARRPAPAASRA